MAKNYGLKYFLAKEAVSGWDLKAMEELGCEYAYVGIPLFFDLPRAVKAHTIKLRAIPTVSYNHHLPHKSGICGQWIRPEDIDLYEDLIYIMEFEFCEVKREETLFKVYAQSKEWSTRLDILIEDLGSTALNRLIPEDLIETRLNCRQRCMGGESTCHLCETVMHMAEAETFSKIKNAFNKK